MANHRLRFALLAPACGSLLMACAGNGEGLDANGRPLAPGGEEPIPLSADFDSLQANIFTPICSVCHVGGGAPEGLRLDAANSYNLLVGVPSTEVPTSLRVAPGDPDNSYIIQKLEGHAAVGAQMPFGGPYLSTTTIGFIRQWISNGAPPGSASAPAVNAVVAHAAGTTAVGHAAPAAAVGNTAPLAIVSVLPRAQESLSQSPPQIVIALNHAIDASQFDGQLARIDQLMPDEPWMAGGDAAEQPRIAQRIAARITAPLGNPAVLMLWPAHALTTGHYRVVLDTTLPSQVTDLQGQSLSLGSAGGNGETIITTFDVEVQP
jgi:hypothetical protein